MKNRTAEIHDGLKHPVIDGDGADAIMNNLDAFRLECSREELGRPEHVTDGFEAAGINSKEDV